MTMPDTATSGDAMSTQLLLSISKDVSALVTDVAVIKSQMSQVSDHENRIRELRSEVPPNLIERLGAVEAAAQQAVGGKDVSARLSAWGLGLLGIGTGIAGYLHH